MKICDELINEISNYIAHGNTKVRSCLLCDISEAIFYEWVKKGKADIEAGIESIHTKFVTEMKKARQKFIACHVSNIENHSSVDWKASAWLLERTEAPEFGKKDNLDLTTKGDKLNSPIDMKKLSIETLQEIANIDIDNDDDNNDKE